MFARTFTRLKFLRGRSILTAVVGFALVTSTGVGNDNEWWKNNNRTIHSTPTTTITTTSTTLSSNASPSSSPVNPSSIPVILPTRDQSIRALKRPDVIYDILVIGGGATGSGVALDAVTRGLSVALVEADDFSSGASSRSTKLIHGGIRYLEKAVKQLDKGQYNLVHEALAERSHFLTAAPHLTRSFPIIVPLYSDYPQALFYGPYYWIGCKAYDWVAGSKGKFESSHWLTRSQALEKFPMLNPDRLKGGVVYYDGQQNDARVCLGIALTANAYGANCVNHVTVTSLVKDGERVVGANVKDNLTGEEWTIRSKETINCTGPLTDRVRQQADPSLSNCITPSAGVHVVIPSSYCPPDMGLIVPATSDGRVLFLLPWEGSTLIGTTDYLSTVTPLPTPQEKDIEFILHEVSCMLKTPIPRSQVLSAWSGIRPLAKDMRAKDTQSVSRDHLIENTAPGMITISGGKWTTYRKMAEDGVNAALKEQSKLKENSTSSQVKSQWLVDLQKLKPCQTWSLPIIGATNYNHDTLASTLPTLLPPSLSPDPTVSAHLIHNYGDRAPLVARLAFSSPLLAQKLSPSYPFIKAEIVYAMQHEYAMRVVDVIGHRTRLSFLNSKEAERVIPQVIDIMKEYYHWDKRRINEEWEKSHAFVETMNLNAIHENEN